MLWYAIRNIPISCCPPTIAATTCILLQEVTRRWGQPSHWISSHVKVAGPRIHIEDVSRDASNSVASRFGAGEPTCFHIAHRWLAKEAAVLPAELARTFIANLEGGTRSEEHTS